MDETNKNVHVYTYFRFSPQSGFPEVILVEWALREWAQFFWLLLPFNMHLPRDCWFSIKQSAQWLSFPKFFPKLRSPQLSVVKVILTFQNFPGQWSPLWSLAVKLLVREVRGHVLAQKVSCSGCLLCRHCSQPCYKWVANTFCLPTPSSCWPAPSTETRLMICLMEWGTAHPLGWGWALISGAQLSEA